MEHTKHIWRAVIILLALPIVFITVRHFLVPPSFGAEGHYRYDSLSEHRDHPVIHGSTTACRECHESADAEKGKGKHVSLSCEVCHAPLALHVKDGKKIADMPKNKSYTLCAGCHQQLEARPKDFPQIDVEKHPAEQGGSLEDGCVTCHDGHNP